MSTFMANKGNIERKWYVIDAAGKPMGKTAVAAADLLRGKLKVTYTPHADCGDNVIIINASKAVLTGNKMEQKYYRTHSGWVGGLKETKYRILMAEKIEHGNEFSGSITKFEHGNLAVDFLLRQNVCIPGERRAVDHADAGEVRVIDVAVIAPVSVQKSHRMAFVAVARHSGNVFIRLMILVDELVPSLYARAYIQMLGTGIGKAGQTLR